MFSYPKSIKVQVINHTSNFKNPSRTSKSTGPLSPFLLRSYPFLLLNSFNSDFQESFGCKTKQLKHIKNGYFEGRLVALIFF